LRYIGDEYRTIRVRFEFQRDPRDAIFIELAIAGEATHLITMDPDLLSLPTARTDAGKRFRQRLGGLTVQTPQTFIETWGDTFGFH
jgi:predicted nucleic acid-binding protein